MDNSFWSCHSSHYTLLHSVDKCGLPQKGYDLQRCHFLQPRQALKLPTAGACLLAVFPQMGSKFFLEGSLSGTSYQLHIAKLHTRNQRQNADKIDLPTASVIELSTPPLKPPLIRWLVRTMDIPGFLLYPGSLNLPVYTTGQRCGWVLDRFH